MPRTRAIALVFGVAVLAAAALSLWWPRSTPTLDCPADQVHLDADGVAICGQGRALPVGQALTVGQKFDLNAASAAELALVPGVTREVAEAIVVARVDGGAFTNWDQIDAVPGVGHARLLALQEVAEIALRDAGL